MGALIAAPISDKYGRKYTIIFWNIIFCIGVIVQITTTNIWYQVSLGRWVAGLGVGGLSVLTPMYQSETAPRYVRGALVSCYQLFITLGIFVAYCINFGTEAQRNSNAWKIPMGVGFIWSFLMMVGILFLEESPRWEYRQGKVDSARRTIALSYGVTEDHPHVRTEIQEIETKLEAERAGGDHHPWYEIFTGPRMMYRTLLGITLQMLQQLTGANYFFYYGTTVFNSVGIKNSYVTSIILGGVNFGMTFPGLYIVEKYGRRPSLIYGALWMFMCFLVFASLGHFALPNPDGTSNQGIGYAMIVFACLFISAFAMTWGPIVWAVVGEIYPSRYRAKCMALATVSGSLSQSGFEALLTQQSRPRTGYGTSCSASSRRTSRPRSTTGTATCLRDAVSLAHLLYTSSCANRTAVLWKKLTRCIFWASLHGRVRTGILRLARIC
jgi:SP family sugar:H+ symporter-like MFS transporter